MNKVEFIEGNEKDALHEAGNVGVENKGILQKLKTITGSAAGKVGAVLLSVVPLSATTTGCNEEASAESKNINRPVASASEGTTSSSVKEEEKGHEYWKQFYDRYTPSDKVDGLVFMEPWNHEVGPSLMGVSAYIHKEMTEEFVTEYLNHFNHRKVSEMKASWDKSLDKNDDGKRDDSEGGREFLPEFFVFSGKVDTLAAEGSPDRGVVSLDGSTAMFARKLTDAPGNDQLSDYKDKTIIIVRGAAGDPDNPLGIATSDLAEMSTEDLQDILKWHSQRDFTGLLAIADK